MAVQHPTGMFDAGFFEGIESYDYKPRKADQGLSGTMSSKPGEDEHHDVLVRRQLHRDGEVTSPLREQRRDLRFHLPRSLS